jgi:hypothetical protein
MGSKNEVHCGEVALVAELDTLPLVLIVCNLESGIEPANFSLVIDVSAMSLFTIKEVLSTPNLSE